MCKQTALTSLAPTQALEPSCIAVVSQRASSSSLFPSLALIYLPIEPRLAKRGAAGRKEGKTTSIITINYTLLIKPVVPFNRSSVFDPSFPFPLVHLFAYPRVSHSNSPPHAESRMNAPLTSCSLSLFARDILFTGEK